ncbi:unnamed protein product, partial [Rotaria sp. Silwood1]
LIQQHMNGSAQASYEWFTWGVFSERIMFGSGFR